VTVENEQFAGGPFDWFTPYTLLVSAGIVAGYALLGATWLMLKTKDNLHGDAKRWTLISAACTAGLLAAVSLATLFVHPRIALRWGFDLTQGFGVDWSVLGPLLPVPLLGLAGLILLVGSVRRSSHVRPFIGTILVFLSGYLGLAASFTPYIVPYAVDFRQAAAPDNALGLMLVGTLTIVPAILAYTAWVYWVFRGKIDEDAGYHH
jgi:cytochrome d ubiquinol oxidase subunit II